MHSDALREPDTPGEIAPVEPRAAQSGSRRPSQRQYLFSPWVGNGDAEAFETNRRPPQEKIERWVVGWAHNLESTVKLAE